jgi:hypothetical protein
MVGGRETAELGLLPNKQNKREFATPQKKKKKKTTSSKNSLRATPLQVLFLSFTPSSLLLISL